MAGSSVLLPLRPRAARYARRARVLLLRGCLKIHESGDVAVDVAVSRSVAL